MVEVITNKDAHVHLRRSVWARSSTEMSANPKNIVEQIRESGLSIYHSKETFKHLFIENDQLEQILDSALVGANLDYPIRTRAKVAKSLLYNKMISRRKSLKQGALLRLVRLT
jgi:hypothetical protein